MLKLTQIQLRCPSNHQLIMRHPLFNSYYYLGERLCRNKKFGTSSTYRVFYSVDNYLDRLSASTKSSPMLVNLAPTVFITSPAP